MEIDAQLANCADRVMRVVCHHTLVPNTNSDVAATLG